jgi:DNA helicase-2/ATP-dependent DNA helicase PcrA
MEGLRQDSLQLDVMGLVDALLDRIGYHSYIKAEEENSEERWENVMELRSTAIDYQGMGPGEGLTALLEQVALVADVDSYDENADVITLITLHQAKGLEFPVVFITGMEEGLLPHYRSLDNPRELEEERRLCYVGITRCKDRLYLTRAFRRVLMGRSGPTVPSRFLAEIPADLIAPGEAQGPKPKVWTASSDPKQEEEESVLELKTGDKVSHATFGQGVVVSCAGQGRDMEVRVAFEDGMGVKRLLLTYAPLKKVEG